MADSEQIETHIKSVLEDPAAEVIAQTYAEAFLGAADSVGIDSALEEFESFLTDVLDRNPEFSTIILSDFVKPEEKSSIIDRVIGPSGSELFTSFLKVLAEHGRLNLLPVILHQSKIQHELKSGKQRVAVKSATPLSDDDRGQIHDRLNAALPFEPITSFDVDETLLGGLVIQIGDSVYDTSLRTRIRQLRERLRERNLNEIQSRRDSFSHPEGD